MARVPTKIVAEKIAEFMKASPGPKSLAEICAGIESVGVKQAKCYYLLKSLVEQKICSYDTKRGKIKLFELIGDISTAVFKEKAEKPVAEAKAEEAKTE